MKALLTKIFQYWKKIVSRQKTWDEIIKFKYYISFWNLYVDVHKKQALAQNFCKTKIEISRHFWNYDDERKVLAWIL